MNSPKFEAAVLDDQENQIPVIVQEIEKPEV